MYMHFNFFFTKLTCLHTWRYASFTAAIFIDLTCLYLEKEKRKTVCVKQSMFGNLYVDQVIIGIFISAISLEIHERLLFPGVIRAHTLRIVYSMLPVITSC
jgi:hypothetical protein